MLLSGAGMDDTVVSGVCTGAGALVSIKNDDVAGEDMVCTATLSTYGCNILAHSLYSCVKHMIVDTIVYSAHPYFLE